MKVTQSELDAWEEMICQRHNYYAVQTERLTQGIERIKRENPKIKKAIRFFEGLSRRNEIKLFYFGGFLRDAYLGFMPRDLDIVAENGWERLPKLVEKATVRRNRFGGLKLDVQGVEVDLWEARSTQAFSDPIFRYRQSSYFLPKTTVFNAESIIFEVLPPFGGRIGLEHGFFHGCETKTLEIQNRMNIDFLQKYAALTLARAYKLHQKLGWKFGPLLQAYVKDELSRTPPGDIVKFYESHYGEPCDVDKVVKELRTLSH